MIDPIAFFLKEAAAHARALPLSDSVIFLKGALQIAGDHDAMRELRGTYTDLSSADDQLEIIASGQMKFEFSKPGKTATEGETQPQNQSRP